jgi:hypothetical protein
LPPIKRIIGSWVKKIAMPRKIISFTPYGSDSSKVCPKLFSVSHKQFYRDPFRSFHCLDFIRSFSKKHRDKPRITASPICPNSTMKSGKQWVQYKQGHYCLPSSPVSIQGGLPVLWWFHFS